MGIELLQQNSEAPLWAVRHDDQIIGALKYLGSAKWEYMDEDGERQFDAGDVDEAKTHVEALVKVKAAETKTQGSVVLINLGAFFRHQLEGFEALAAITEGGIGPYTSELMIGAASVLADIEDDTKRTEAREHLLMVLDENVRRRLDRKRRMADIGGLVSHIFQMLERSEASQGEVVQPPEEKPPTH